MQNSIQKFKQNFIVFEKAGLLTEKLKHLVSSNPNNIYLQKGVRDIYFFFYLDLKSLLKM